MARTKSASANADRPKMRPALTPESRENQMIALAVDRAEEQLRDGTASSQLICHYLKLGTSRAKLETELLKSEVELKKAKTESLQSMKRMEELYTNAIRAMREYGGHGSSEDDEYED